MTETTDERTPIAQAPPEEYRARLTAARKEVGRELGLRKAVYKTWVRNGRLSREDAVAQYFAMDDVYAILKRLESDLDEADARERYGGEETEANGG